ncbi:hypothetical protein ACJA3J_02845 [Halobacillus sp. SY10]|uniref:hypothetical protein n=1 Tax=Halobacillus sp. SY10 TaxID=3381356 RepID=UPI0038792888
MNPDLCELLANDGFLRCYLTNMEGIPVDAPTCEELQQQGGRENIEVLLPGGEQAMLQIVRIKSEGYVVIEVGDEDSLCISDPIPFCFVETLILCAQDGTTVSCEVMEFECQPCVNCRDGEFESLDIQFNVCLSVQTEADVVIEVEAGFCQPREPITPPSCDFSVPNQCPPLFPLGREAQEVDKEDEEECNSDVVKPKTLARTRLQESACVSVAKVYDWVIQQKTLERTIDAADINFMCNPCEIHLFVPADIVCDRFLSGKVICGDVDEIEGAEVTFSAEPAIVDFVPDSVFTDDHGNFEVEAIIEAVTEPTPVVITATTVVNGEMIQTSLPTIVQCLTDPCIIELFAPEEIFCDGFVSGRVRCDGRVIEGVAVTLESSNPAIVTFDPNPVVTGSLGDYFAGVILEDETPPQTITITASATVEGQPISNSVDVFVECDRPC